MDYIALTGPCYSGKTSLSKALAGRGYLFIPFNDLLKRMAADMLNDYGFDTTFEDIQADKKKYRGFLQGLGTVANFDSDPIYIQAVCREWESLGKLKAVFDNVRTQAQADNIKGYGFKLVQIDLPRSIQYLRARELGVSQEELDQVMGHYIERGVEGADLVIDGTRPIAELVEQLIAD